MKKLVALLVAISSTSSLHAANVTVPVSGNLGNWKTYNAGSKAPIPYATTKLGIDLVQGLTVGANANSGYGQTFLNIPVTGIVTYDDITGVVSNITLNQLGSFTAYYDVDSDGFTDDSYANSGMGGAVTFANLSWTFNGSNLTQTAGNASGCDAGSPICGFTVAGVNSNDHSNGINQSVFDFQGIIAGFQTQPKSNATLTGYGITPKTWTATPGVSGLTVNLLAGSLTLDVASRSNSGAVSTNAVNTATFNLFVSGIGSDSDSDGIGDAIDNCPSVNNPDQLNNDGDSQGNACDPTPFGTDTDDDGVLDNFDNCPNVSNADQSNNDGDSQGNACDLTPNGPDTDGDGIADSLDNCPTVNNADQLNTDGDSQGNACDSNDDNDGYTDDQEVACGSNPLSASSSCANIDNDNDGVNDIVDNCPALNNSDQLNTDGDSQGNACDDNDDNDTDTDIQETVCGSDPLSAGSYCAIIGQIITAPVTGTLGQWKSFNPSSKSYTNGYFNPLSYENAKTGIDLFQGLTPNTTVPYTTIPFPSFLSIPLTGSISYNQNTGEVVSMVLTQIGSITGYYDVGSPSGYADGVTDDFYTNDENGSTGGGLTFSNLHWQLNGTKLNQTQGTATGCDSASPLCEFTLQGVNTNDHSNGISQSVFDFQGINAGFVTLPRSNTTQTDYGTNYKIWDYIPGVSGLTVNLATGALSISVSSRINSGSSSTNAANLARMNLAVAGIGSDADGDGIGDAIDNCPSIANSDQLNNDNDDEGNVCDTTPNGPDTDGDGITDSVDNCPTTTNSDQLNTDGDIQGNACDSDSDNDGVADSSDAFPLNPNESADNDSDGIGNNSDNCQAISNSNQLNTDNDTQGDACDADADNDGMPNDYELTNGFNPLWAGDASEDADADGFSNNSEYTASTDPRDSSSTPPAISSALYNFEDGIMPSEFIKDPSSQQGWQIDATTGANSTKSIRATPIGHYGTAGFKWDDHFLQGTLEMDLFYESETCCDYFRIYVDGVMVVNRSGYSYGWQHISLNLTTGHHQIRFVYSKDGSVVYGQDTARIDNLRFSFQVDTDNDGVTDSFDNCPSISNANQSDADFDGQGDACDSDADNDGMSNTYELQYGFDPYYSGDALWDYDGDGFSNLKESSSSTDPTNASSAPEKISNVLFDFEDGIFPTEFTQNGYSNRGWIIDSPPSSSSLKSIRSDIIGDNQSAGFVWREYFLKGTLELDFVYDTEQYGDYLYIYVDGILVRSFTGNGYTENSGYGYSYGYGYGYGYGGNTWQHLALDLEEGEHEIRFVYSKNGAISVGQDASRIDNITYLADILKPDQDEDGIWNGIDNCPSLSNSSQSNYDGDSEGDACDNDDDNDGVADTSDAFPFNSYESADTDSDGIGNNSDNCPTISNSDQLNTDGDSQGNACDSDADNDGMPNDYELANGFNPLWAGDASQDTDGDGFSNYRESLAGTDPRNSSSTPPFISSAFFDFETGVFPSSFTKDPSSQLNWQIDNIGLYSQKGIRSAGIPHGGSTGFIWQDGFKKGVLEFDYRVSSEGGWDFFRLYVDGILQLQGSGTYSGWQHFSINLNQGFHQIRFVYTKDPQCCTSGEDAIRIDNIRYTMVIDTDADGVTDSFDNCPSVSNSNQSDVDFDGKGDACDDDADNDGMSNTYELQYGFNPLYSGDALQDADGDGFSNLKESRSNTDPKNSASAPAKVSDVLYDFEDGIFPSAFIKDPLTNKGWIIDSPPSSNSLKSIRSDVIGDNQSAGFAWREYFNQGTLEFDFVYDTEQGWDFLKVYVDGVLVRSFSGNGYNGSGYGYTYGYGYSNTGNPNYGYDYSYGYSYGYDGNTWQHLALNLSEGEHEIRFVYSKDSVISVGQDAARIDNIRYLADSKKDDDKDGILNGLDNCPMTSNTDQADSDSDGKGNRCDNCSSVSNPNQIDVDLDGYGNMCDGDFNNDNIVGNPDMAAIRNAVGTSGSSMYDLNTDGVVNTTDLTRFKALFGKAPGPSGLRSN